MDPLTALSLASSVVQLVDFGVKLCALVKECSDIAGCPAEVLTLSQRLEAMLQTLNDLSETGRAILQNEATTLTVCIEKAKGLLLYLEGFKVGPASEKGSGNMAAIFLDRRKLDLRKVGIVFRTKWQSEKIQQLNLAMDQMLGLIQLQSQLRVENTTSRLETKTDTVIQQLGQMKLVRPNSHEIKRDTQKPELQTLFLVSACRNNTFIGREAILKELVSRIKHREAYRVCEVAFYGLGGIGKSQLALEYAYQNKEGSPNTSVFWVHAANVGRFEQDYKAIAKAFNLSDYDDPHTDTLQLVHDWLEDQYEQSWLMIIDNVDGNQLFDTTTHGRTCREYIPQKNSKGTIIYTSRNREICCQLVDDPIHVPSMTETEGRTLLGNRLISTSTNAEIQELLEELDFLPLALMQASKYMIARRKKVSQYLQQFRASKKSKISLLKHRFSDTNRRERGLESVAATWMISFDHIRDECPRSGELLCLMSCLDRQGIPRSLIIDENENTVEFDRAVGLLEDYSLISMDDDNTLYTLHRLVHAVTNAWVVDQNNKEEARWAVRALETTSKRFPEYPKFENFPLCALYLPHVDVVLGQSSVSPNSTEDKKYLLAKAHLLRCVSCFSRRRGQGRPTMQYIKESLNIYESLLEFDSIEVFDAKSEMVDCLIEEQELDKAEVLCRHILEGLEKRLGSENLTTLHQVLKLAFILHSKGGQLIEAEILAQRALQGQESLQSGKSQWRVRRSMRVLGIVQESSGKLDEAEKTFRELLDIEEVKFGKMHPDTIKSTCYLGVTLLKHGKYVESEKLLRQALENYMNLLGIKNSDTLWCMYSYTQISHRMGQLDRAENLCRDALSHATKELGKTHWSTINIAEELGDVLRDKGSYSSAEEILREAITWKEVRCRGTEHHLLASRWGLAQVIDKQGRHAEAEVMLRDVLEKVIEEVGQDNDVTNNVKWMLHMATLRRERKDKASTPVWSLFSSNDDDSCINHLWDISLLRV